MFINENCQTSTNENCLNVLQLTSKIKLMFYKWKLFQRFTVKSQWMFINENCQTSTNENCLNVLQLTSKIKLMFYKWKLFQRFTVKSQWMFYKMKIFSGF